MASNVGLGWALQAGGTVSRVLRGLPDESSAGFWNTAYIDPSTGNDPRQRSSYQKANAGQIDLEADVFSYSVNGRSGKFTYGRNGDILLIDDSRMQITRQLANNTLSGFTLTDEQGIQYVFDAAETTSASSPFLLSITYVSSWQLTKIQSANGEDAIQFAYNDVSNINYTASRSQTITGEVNSNAIGPSSTGSQSIALSAKTLKSILLPNGVSVLCEYDPSQRTDLAGDYLLRQITVQDSKGQMARGVLLEQDYSLAQRATLRKVTPFAGSTTKTRLNPYQFFYSSGLPARLDSHKDHWGYPTGYVFNPGANTELIPREIFGNSIGGRYELPGINRDTDADWCRAGTLSRIIYPTGGYTDFTLEANQATDGWLTQNVSVTVPSSPTDRSESTYLSLNNGAPAYQDSYFTFNGTQADYTEFSLNITPVSASQVSSSSGQLRVEVFPTTGNTQSALLSVDFTYPFTSAEQGKKRFVLPGGAVSGAQYRLRFYYNAVGVNSFSTSAQLQWREDTHQSRVVTYSHNQAYVGGLRVKMIADYDGISTNPVSVRNYAYLREDGTSSGVLASYPTYTYSVYYSSTLIMGDNYPAYVPNAPLLYVRSSSSAHDIVYTNGSPVTYSRVVETQVGPTGPNGKTVRSFSTTAPSSGGQFPFVPQQSFDWAAGQLLLEQVYNAAGTLLTKTEHAYAVKYAPAYTSPAQIQNFTSCTIAPVAFMRPYDYRGTPTLFEEPGFPPYWFLHEHYLPRAGRSDLISTITTAYDANGTNAQVQTIAYEYDPVYYYLKRKRSTDGQGQPVIEEYTYAPDRVATGSTGPYGAMVSRNMLSPVLETARTVNGSARLAMSTLYQQGWPGNGMAILPALVQTQFQTQAPETRLRYDRYDNKGNPLSQAKAYGTPSCYVWSYNKQYVVAEIKNVDYATLETVLGGATALNTFGNLMYPTDATVKDFLAVLRTDPRLARSQVTTYSYSPLAGLTSQRDPAGRLTTYEYDDFGRLLRTRDEQSRILSQQEYQYGR